MKTSRVTRNALLTAIALTIFMIEAQLPPLAPIPGIKLGLANIVTLYALYRLGPRDALGILLARIILGSLFAGQLMTMLYSLTGGLLCWGVGCILVRVMPLRQIWLCSIFGAMAHNIGQLTAAIWVTRTPALLTYLPVLLISGILTGAFTGFAALFLCERMGKR